MARKNTIGRNNMKPYEALIVVGLAAVVAVLMVHTGQPIAAVVLCCGIVAVAVGAGLYMWYRYGEYL